MFVVVIFLLVTGGSSSAVVDGIVVGGGDDVLPSLVTSQVRLSNLHTFHLCTFFTSKTFELFLKFVPQFRMHKLFHIFLYVTHGCLTWAFSAFVVLCTLSGMNPKNICHSFTCHTLIQ